MWHEIVDEKPEFDEVCWLWDGQAMWIGVRKDAGDDWMWCDTHGEILWNGTQWECLTADDTGDRFPTHWMSLPLPPVD